MKLVHCATGQCSHFTPSKHILVPLSPLREVRSQVTGDHPDSEFSQTMDIKKVRIKEKTVFKIFKHGIGEIVQWLKALAELGRGGTRL